MLQPRGARLRSLIQTTSLVAVTQSLVLSAFLVASPLRSRRPSNWLLAGLLFAFALITTGFLVMSSSYYRQWYALATLTNQVAFLIGPLLYLHIVTFDASAPSLRVRHLVHSLPFVAAAAAVGAVFALAGDPFAAVDRIVVASSAGVLVHNLAYFVASVRVLHAQGVQILKGRHKNGAPQTSWLQFILLGYLVIWAARLQFFLVGSVTLSPRWCPYTMSLYFLSAFLFSNSAVFIALDRPELFGPPRRKAGPSVAQGELDALRQRLLALMEIERPYRDPELTLAVLATRMGVTRRQLSQVLNQGMGTGFPDFVNRYRVEDAKLLLGQHRHRHTAVLEIAFDVGFASKSTFNAAFKKHTGTTPREFRTAAG